MSKKIIILIICVSFCYPVYAEKFMVEAKDGSARRIDYVAGASDSLADVISDLGHTGGRVIRYKESDLPPAEDRQYWKLNDIPIGKKVVVDELKKDYDAMQSENDKKEKEEKIAATIKKICPSCTEAEFRDLINGLE